MYFWWKSAKSSCFCDWIEMISFVSYWENLEFWRMQLQKIAINSSHSYDVCAAVKWWRHKSDGICPLLPDPISVELLRKSVIAVLCPLLKQCRPMWSLLRSDLRDKAFHTKIYSMVCWQKEGSKNVMLHPSIQGKRKDTFNLGKRVKFLIVSVTF